MMFFDGWNALRQYVKIQSVVVRCYAFCPVIADPVTTDPQITVNAYNIMHTEGWVPIGYSTFLGVDRAR